MTQRCKPQSCLGCDCYSHGTDFIQVTGSGSFGIGLIGEASGEMEAREQRPFVEYAPAGSVLERTLRRLGYSRDQFFTANCLFCRPRENFLDGAPWEQSAIRHCQPNLLAALHKFRPKILIALGNIPLRTLTGISGKQRTVSHLQGYVFRALPEFCDAADNDDLLVIPTYHPSFLRRGAIHLTGVFARDIQRAVNIRSGKDKSYILDMPTLGEGSERDDSGSGIAAWMERYNLRYQLHPTLRDLDLFCRDVKARSDAWLALSPDMQRADMTALAYDLETYESADLDEDESDGFSDTRIQLAQFSIAPRTGIAFPWKGEYIQASRWLLKLPLPKLGQNVFLFDNRVLRAVGKRDYLDGSYFSPAGRVFDTMQAFHYWQPDLPAHLQAAASFVQFEFPWKHYSGSNLEFYGICDVDAPQRLYPMLIRTMRERGIWDDSVLGREAAGYINQVEAVRPILAAMEDRGFPVDDAKRLALDKEFEQAEKEAMAELDLRYPNQARRLHPKDGYKGIPPQVKKLLAEGMEESEVSTVLFQDPPEKQDDGTEEPGASYRYEQREFVVAAVDDKGEPTTATTLRWCRVYQFSPNSPKQLKNYIEHKGHKIPKKKTGEDTTGKVELQRLAAKHHDDFYLKVIECREIGKMRGTYIDGFKPQADERVHTTFTFATSTGQLTSRNPVNFQNVPKHGRLAKPIRAMFSDRNGKLIVEWDKKSYHVMTTGLEAKSLQYMRLARIDMHSFVTWHFLKLPGADALFDLPDEELAAKLKWLKSDEKRKYVRDFKAKRAVLGIGYGMGARKLYDMYRENFESEAEAKRLRSMIESLFPEVFRWQNQVKDLAHKQQYLKNRFGMIRWFFEVYVPDKRGGWTGGEQAEQAVAFLPASNAFGDLREIMKDLDRRGYCDKWQMVNTVHDSLVFLVDKHKMDEHIADVYPVLRAPSKVLVDPDVAPEGLVVDVECSAGESWAETKEIKLH